MWLETLTRKTLWNTDKSCLSCPRLFARKKRNDAISWDSSILISQNCSNILKKKKKTFKGNEILCFLTFMLVKPA